MDESGRSADALRRRIYLIALGVSTPFMPAIGWVRAGDEPFALPVYGTLTVGMLVTLIGLATRRLAVSRAEGLLVIGVASVVLLRLVGVAYVADLAPGELKALVVETTGPTLIACVLIIYLAAELRAARGWALALWALFTLLLLPHIVTGWSDPSGLGIALARQSMTLGAVVGLAYGLASLKTQLTEERVRARALDELASTDPLTGVSNRRGAEQALRQALARADRYGGALSVALLDLDRFKARNDHHGHAAGDAALVAVVSALRADLRTTDLIGRWGGDELLVVTPDTSPADARRSAERWRRTIAELGLAAGPARVTTSVGLATHQPGDSLDTLLARADRALYAAKALGGDTVVTDEGQVTPAIVPARDGTQPA
ncbi:GGDEF domain-containing protein [Nitriliruptor alkaliphilus]|uniref:GGDEF domain-containing protein n=1 Tax=Nitriliruptor alkaliphilus TaxID=427918 RepID=UPI0006982AFD|nr:GGDEF domain-containing protein [Nitriliruptor alkaliphilus]